MSSRVIGFKPHVGEIEKRETGSMTFYGLGKDAWLLSVESPGSRSPIRRVQPSKL